MKYLQLLRAVLTVVTLFSMFISSTVFASSITNRDHIISGDYTPVFQALENAEIKQAEAKGLLEELTIQSMEAKSINVELYQRLRVIAF